MIGSLSKKNKLGILQVQSGVYQKTPRRHIETRITKRQFKNIQNYGKADANVLHSHINR